ncbi:MAG: thiol protease/hemagglutinin PrtT [Bacteroidales bacterium]|nr:thiol protease/hemagglutinin PrtT [Bacteroidales bacterium]
MSAYNKISLCVLAWCLAIMAVASPVDSAKARAAAQHFWSQQVRASAQLVEVTNQMPYAHLHLFNCSGGGFVIVADDDCAKPVLGYSLQGSLNTADMPPALHYWLGFYDCQIAWARTEQVSSPEAVQAWTALLAGMPADSKYADTVAPMLTTTWSQRPWYNELCPTDNNLPYGHPTTGCTATGMAQVMKYWNHPRHGYGSYSYSWEGVQPYWTYGTLSADFENTYYDWDNMPDALNWNSTSTQVNAVAQLMSHVGISIQMSYNLYGDSGSDAPVALLEFTDPMYVDHTYCPENALPQFFGYKASLRGIAREGIADTVWDNMLREDISHGRPVLYGGFGVDPNTGETNGGHCFVLDGYDNNGYFHLNWGWGGSCDGYFLSSALNPASYVFSDRQEAIFGIEPDYSHLEMNSDLSIPSPIIWDNEVMGFNFSIRNKGDSTFSGQIGIGIWDTNEVFYGWSLRENVSIESMAFYVGQGVGTFLPNMEQHKEYIAALMYGDTLPEYPVFENGHVNHCHFSISGVGISSLDEHHPIITTQHRQITVKDMEQKPIIVYNVLGSVLYQNANPHAETFIPVQTAGVYLVRVGSTTTKVVIP